MVVSLHWAAVTRVLHVIVMVVNQLGAWHENANDKCLAFKHRVVSYSHKLAICFRQYLIAVHVI